MNGSAYNIKKISIITGIIFLIIITPLIIISIINSGFRVEKVYHVRSDMPLLMICFNKEVKNDTSVIKSQSFTATAQPAHDNKCTAFRLTTTVAIGHYLALISVESSSGQKVADYEILVEVVDTVDDSSLSDDELNKLVNANNSVEINKSIVYWKQQPIYKFVEPSSLSYNGGNWTISLRADEKLSPIIAVYINMPTPPKNSSILNHIADQYKKEALDKIREWRFNPDDYTIEFRFSS